MPVQNRKIKKIFKQKNRKILAKRLAKTWKNIRFKISAFSKSVEKFLRAIKGKDAKNEKKKTNTKKIFQISKPHWIAVGILFFIFAISFGIFGILKTKGATFGWVQTNWAGGVDTNAKANHASDQSNWTKFFSKDSNIETTDSDIKLAKISDSFATTSDSDFNSGTKTLVFVNGTGVSGAVYAQKNDGVACSTNQECINNLCLSSFCISPCSVSTICGTNCAFNGLTYGTIATADGKCWFDRNLGATRVATAINDSFAYGWYFQWGRFTDGHQINNSSVTAILSSSNTPGHSSFITNTVSNYDWRNPKNDSLWQGVNGINNPCPSGFRLPTRAEWVTIVSTLGITNINTSYSSVLKLPAVGNRSKLDGTMQYQGTLSYYWSSDISNSYDNWNASNVYIYAGGCSPSSTNSRAFGFPVRCIKN